MPPVCANGGLELHTSLAADVVASAIDTPARPPLPFPPSPLSQARFAIATSTPPGAHYTRDEPPRVLRRLG